MLIKCLILFKHRRFLAVFGPSMQGKTTFRFTDLRNTFIDYIHQQHRRFLPTNSLQLLQWPPVHLLKSSSFRLRSSSLNGVDLNRKDRKPTAQS